MEELAGDRFGSARCAGLERLLSREDVQGSDEDLASDGGLGRVGLAVSALDVDVELVPRVGRALRLLRGFDGCPAKRLRSGLGELADPSSDPARSSRAAHRPRSARQAPEQIMQAQ
jgi:hypothetical protein